VLSNPNGADWVPLYGAAPAPRPHTGGLYARLTTADPDRRPA